MIDLNKAKIGLELEFFRADIANNVKDVFDKDPKNVEKLKNIYNDFIKNWLDEYADRFGFEEGILESLYKGGGREEHKEHAIEYTKVTHELVTTENVIKYWIKPTLDQKCVEIIAQPLTVAQYNDNEVKDFWGNFLFEIMEKLDFYTDDTNAAGHLNVDYATGFDSNFNNVLELMRYINNLSFKKNKICQYLDSLQINNNDKDNDPYSDPQNALYIGDLVPKKKAFANDSEKMIGKIRGSYERRLEEILNISDGNQEERLKNQRKKLKNLMEQVRAIYLNPRLDKEVKDFYHKEFQEKRKKLLKEFFFGKEEEVENVVADVIDNKENLLQNGPVEGDWNLISEHYMAINTESFDEKPIKNSEGIVEEETKENEDVTQKIDERWRVEFRAVKMPANYDELLVKIECVKKILNEIINKQSQH